MKKIITLSIILSLAVGTLAGCSSNGSQENKQENNSAQNNAAAQSAGSLSGTFTMTSYIKDGEPVDLSDNNSKGLYTTLELKEDGTGVYDFFGIKSDVTYDSQSINLSGAKSAYTVSGDIITITSGATTMVFKKALRMLLRLLPTALSRQKQITVFLTHRQPSLFKQMRTAR